VTAEVVAAQEAPGSSSDCVVDHEAVYFLGLELAVFETDVGTAVVGRIKVAWVPPW
jgi:hypothetical protein